jgi:hypothetical protein
VRSYRDRQALDTLWRLRAECLDAIGGRDAEACKCRRRAERVRACQFREPRATVGAGA